MQGIVLYLLATGAGVSFVAQQAVNSNLRGEIGSPWWTGFISYLGGTVCMLVMAIVLQSPLSIKSLSQTSVLSWSGGLFGAIYIGISIILLPKLGAATVVALIVLGQMVGSITFDHFGLLGVPVHEVTVSRIAGALLLMTGVFLIRL